MRTGRRARLSLALGAVLVVASLAAPAVGASPAQESPPITVVPPLDGLDPVTAAISPVVWQACRSVGLAVGLVVVAGTIVGVPPEVGVPLNDAFARASGPVLSAFLEVCQQIPLPDEPPDCGFDAQVPPLPSLGRPVLVAGLLANELRALEASLDLAGLPLQGALSQAADDLLACAAGRNPERDAPAAEPADDRIAIPGLVPPGAGPAPGSSDVPRAGAPLSLDEPTVARPSSSDLGLPASPVSTSTSDRAGLAIALLVLAGLASLLWVHAGNPRSRSRRDTSDDAA